MGRGRISIAVVAAALLLAMLSAGPGLAQKSYVVATSVANKTTPFDSHIDDTFDKAFKKHTNIRHLATDGQGKVERQIATIEDMIARRVDFLVVKPIEEKAIADPLCRATKRGIKVITYDRKVVGDCFNVQLLNDSVKVGELTAELMIRILKGKGNVVVLEGVPGATSTLDFKKGFEAGIKKSDIKILASQTANYNQAQGLKLMENYLQAYPNQIDAIYGHNDQMAFGASIAVQNAKVPAGRIKVFGSNGSTDAIKKIIDGEMEASPLYRHGAEQAVQTVLDLIAGKPVQKFVLLAPEMISRENAKAYYQPGTFMPGPRGR
ncbi:MAG: substrate-binding domain-containing protein [Candidatus Rokuibacteriota bacterium]